MKVAGRGLEDHEQQGQPVGLTFDGERETFRAAKRRSNVKIQILGLLVALLLTPALVLAEPPPADHQADKGPASPEEAAIIGKYKGNQGDAPISITLAPNGDAIIDLNGKSLAVKWKVVGKAAQGEPLIHIVDTILFYARTSTGLVMTGAPNSRKGAVPVRDGRGTLFSTLALVSEGQADPVAEGTTEPTEDPAPGGGTPGALPFPWNHYDPQFESHKIEGDDDSGLPSCPPGAKRFAEQQRGLPVVMIGCRNPSGEVEGYFVMAAQNRVKLAEGTMRDGKRQGRYVTRSPKGWKTSDGFYLDDQKNGLWLDWNEDGSFAGQTLWQRGVKVADATLEGGLAQLDVATVTAEFSCPEGTHPKEARAPEAKGSSQATFRYCQMDGKEEKHGPAIGWLPSGQVVFSNRFEHGKDVGPTTIWYPTGQVENRLETDDAGTGVVLRWHEWGVLAARGTLVDGELHGKYEEYTGTGGVRLEGQYLHGRKDGVWRWAGSSGLVEQVWKDGNLKSGRVRGLFGTVPTKSTSPEAVHAGLEALAPVLALSQDWVAVEVLTTKRRAARRSLDRAGHERDRERICEVWQNVYRDVAWHGRGSGNERSLLDDTQSAFCEMSFSRDRNPMVPDAPVLAGCTTSNAGGSLRNTGACVEITPDDCRQVVKKMCNGCKMTWPKGTRGDGIPLDPVFKCGQRGK